MKIIYWIAESNPPRLAIVLRPRGDSGLQSDLAVMKEGGIDVVVSLLTPEDNEDLGLTQEATLARELGLQFFSYPIPDRCTPTDLDSYRALIAELRDLVHSGKRIGAHCRGCIGRSTVLIASVMIALGWNPLSAVETIERARGFTVPDSAEQLEWICQFEA